MRQCLANGIIDAVGFSLFSSVTKFLDFFLSFDKMSRIFIVQAMMLSLGKLTQNMRVFYTHTKKTLIYSNSGWDIPNGDISKFGILRS